MVSLGVMYVCPWCVALHRFEMLLLICVGGDCLIVGGFGCWEVFLVDKFVPCLVYGLCSCFGRFKQLRMLLGCW